MYKLTTRICGWFGAVIVAGAMATGAMAEGPEDLAPEAMSAAQRACGQQPYSILASIYRVREAKGVLVLDLHNDPATFLKKGGKLLRVRVPAVRGETQACIPVPHPGIYAVGMYQDRNLNLKFDKGMFGLPAEPYGASNDPPMNFGPPDFDAAAVKVNGPLTPVKITEH